MISAHINCAGQDKPACDVQALCELGLNGLGWPALSSLMKMDALFHNIFYPHDILPVPSLSKASSCHDDIFYFNLFLNLIKRRRSKRRSLD